MREQEGRGHSLYSCTMNRNLRAVLLVMMILEAVECAAVAQIRASTIIQRLGYAPDSRLLIIHSDDLGMAHSVDMAAFEALEKGWISSASIMVPCPWFSEVAEFARRNQQLDLGLHLTLTSEWKSYRWGPSSRNPVPSLVDKHHYLPHATAALKAADPADVDQELRAQVEKARAAGVNFTHLDSHMGALFETAELYRVYQQVAHDYHVPNLLANAGSPHGKHKLEVAVDTLVISKDLQMRPFRSRKKWRKTYEQMLRQLKPGGVYQLILHLGLDNAELKAISGDASWGATWRQADYDLVRDPEFQQFLREQKFVIITWKDLARAAS